MMMPLLVFAIIALYLVGQIGSFARKGSDIVWKRWHTARLIRLRFIRG